MSTELDAINAAEAALEQAKQGLEAAAAAQAATPAPVSEHTTGDQQAAFQAITAAAPLIDQIDTPAGTYINRDEWNALLERIEDFNRRSGQRI